MTRMPLRKRNTTRVLCPVVSMLVDIVLQRILALLLTYHPVMHLLASFLLLQGDASLVASAP